MSKANSSMRRLGKTAIAVACLLALTPISYPAVAQQAPNKELTKYQRKNREKADKIIELLYQQGRAILVVPTLREDYKYPTKAILDDNLALRVTDKGTSAAIEVSMAMEWVNVTDPEHMVVDSLSVSFPTIGPPGWFFEIPIGNAHYMIFVVEPGTYSLNKVSYPLPRSKIGEGHGVVSGRGAGTIGELRQVASSMFEAEETMVFLNAATATVAASEQCNWWYKGVCTQSVYTPEHTKQVRAAGLYPKTEYLPISAIDVGIKFNDNVASFQVAAGEVVMIDGLFPQPLDADMAVTNCRRGESLEVCALESVELIRAKGSLEQLRAYDFAVERYPRLEKLLDKLQYRPLTLKGQAVGESKFGERYRFGR